jgi:hypothetical protein
VNQSVKLEEDIPLYVNKDAVDIECLGCIEARNACAYLTAADARVFLFVEGGNAYARIQNGRVGQTIDVIASVVLDTGKEIPINLKVIVER